MPELDDERRHDRALDGEDRKLVTLARASAARAGSATGAAVRDQTGRTYTAVPVSVGPLRLTALQLAVAMARASGADPLEAAATIGEPSAADLEVLRAAAAGAHLYIAAVDGTVTRTVSA
jgi:hypothetical protein